MGVIREKKLEVQRTPREVWTQVGFICDGCGKRDDDPWPPWIPIKVEAGESGEEGNQIVEKIFCDECDATVLGALIKLGFCTHYHGSTNFLEDDSCPGFEHYDECPTHQRDRYGNIDPEAEAEWGDED